MCVWKITVLIVISNALYESFWSLNDNLWYRGSMVDILGWQRNKATGSFATANLPQMNHHDSHKKLSPQKTNPYPNSFCSTNGVFLTTTTCTPLPEILILELFFGGTFLNTLNKNLPNVWKFGSSKRHNPGTNCANANGKWPQYWSHFPYGIWRDLLATNYPPPTQKKGRGAKKWAFGLCLAIEATQYIQWLDFVWCRTAFEFFKW